jgi:tetratricopeptide (TPR) repeat protein
LDAFETALRLHGAVRDGQGSTHARMRLAYALTRAGRLDEAEAALADVVPKLKASTPPKLRGFFFSYQGYLALARNDPGTAKCHYERALDLYREAGYDFGVLGSASNLGDVSWQCGDFDVAATAYREVIATRRSLHATRKASLGWNLANLAGVLTEQGKLDEARAAACEAMPLLRNADRVFVFMDHLALRTALTGALDKAAILGGYADRVHAAKKLIREPNEARAHVRLHALLRERIDSTTREQLIAKGASMSEDEACRLALDG